MQFQLVLRNETLESVHKDDDTKNKFNSFICTFLKMSEGCFTIKYEDIYKICKH
jgi:hypothetical protein